MDPVRLFRAAILNPVSEDESMLLSAGAIAVGSDGSIEAVGPYADLHSSFPDAEIIDLADRVIVPGFVDTHTHIPQYPCVGSYGKTLLDWLEAYIYPAEAAFTPDVAERVCPRFFNDLLAHGITSAAIFSSSHKESTMVCFEWAQRIGIRAIIGKMMMDANGPDLLMERTSDSLKASEEVCARWHGADNGRLLYAFTPRFAPTCSQELMESASRLAGQYGAYVQTHIAENLSEVALVKKLFPEAANYADVYQRAGLLGPKTVLGHGIYLCEEERRLLRETDACLAHAPISGLFLKSGLMPLRELMDMHLRIGLASDIAGGPTLSPFDVMRTAIYVHTARDSGTDHRRDITPSTVFYLATLGGAKALSLDATIGSLTPGKEADFVVVNPERLVPLTGAQGADVEADTLLSRLVFRGDDRCVEQTYVRGRLCYSEGGATDAPG